MNSFGGVLLWLQLEGDMLVSPFFRTFLGVMLTLGSSFTSSLSCIWSFHSLLALLLEDFTWAGAVLCVQCFEQGSELPSPLDTPLPPLHTFPLHTIVLLWSLFWCLSFLLPESYLKRLR